jgi:hypothetical protein
MYNTISMESAMSIKPGKARLGHPDRHALIYAVLFMAFALLSALGAGAAALLIGFVPAVAAISVLLRRLRRAG